jgi:pimeloyl-ACP methyl ester carboxylesterase
MSTTDMADARERITFKGAAGNKIAADLYAADGGRTVVLAHGGGQTRHSWRGAARKLAALGWSAITIDQRGHGNSDWIEDGDYSFRAFADDLTAVADQVTDRYGARPVGIGASLGGIASLLAQGEADREVLAGVVLVDITPRVNPSGVDKVLGFMAERSEHGFATLEEAADAISAYLPHRERPKDLSGLSKNLRQGEDGRFRWHWDPRFIERRRAGATREAHEARLTAAAKRLTVPVLLVRGSNSELVDEHLAKEFLTLVPHAEYEDVQDARHMVAGDKNDAFADAVIGFLGRIKNAG